MEGTRVANIEGSLFFPKGSGTNWNIVQIAEGRFGGKPLLLFFNFILNAQSWGRAVKARWSRDLASASWLMARTGEGHQDSSSCRQIMIITVQVSSGRSYFLWGLLRNRNILSSGEGGSCVWLRHRRLFFLWFLLFCQCRRTGFRSDAGDSN